MLLFKFLWGQEAAHTHWTPFLDDQPLVDALVVKVMVTRFQNFDHVCLIDMLKTDSTVIYLTMRGLVTSWMRMETFPFFPWCQRLALC